MKGMKIKFLSEDFYKKYQINSFYIERILDQRNLLMIFHGPKNIKVYMEIIGRFPRQA